MRYKYVYAIIYTGIVLGLAAIVWIWTDFDSSNKKEEKRLAKDEVVKKLLAGEEVTYKDAQFLFDTGPTLTSDLYQLAKKNRLDPDAVDDLRFRSRYLVKYIRNTNHIASVK